MPNWCSTSIRIENTDESLLTHLENEFTKAFRNSSIKNDFGEYWLGNILSYLGYDEATITEGSIKCRGRVTWMEIYDGALCFSTETAWVPMLKPFELMVDTHAPGSRLLYCAVEEGCEIYCTNDPNMIKGVYIDIYDNLPAALHWIEEEEEKFITKKDLLKRVAESMNWTGTDDEIEERITCELSDFFGFHEWEYGDVSAWD